MKRKKASAADVAHLAGVSRTTVSFVINNTPGKNIPEATRRRVLAAAEKVGYSPNEAARTLAMSRRRSIGLLICHSQFVYTDAFIMRVVEGMSLAVNRARLQLVIQPISLNDARYMEIAERLGLDGLVLINAHDNDPGLEHIIRARIPAVAMDYLPEIPVDQVYVDGRAAARIAVDHLIDLGHSRIAMITHADPVYAAARQRIEGYHDSLDRAGIPARDVYLCTGDFSERSGYSAMQRLLDLPEPPSAVFAGNDVVAYGALDAIHARGLTVPDDMSLIGYDDDYLSRFVNPPLTTVALPASGMGSTAVSMLLGRLEDDVETDDDGVARQSLDAHLTRRESCAPPRRVFAS